MESPGGAGGNCGILGAREFKAVEALTSVEARLLVSELVDDMTASGIGDMLRRDEFALQVDTEADTAVSFHVAVTCCVLLAE